MYGMFSSLRGKVAKIMLYNCRNPCRATSSSYRLVQTLKASSVMRMVGVILVFPSHSGPSSLAQCFLKHTAISTCTPLSATAFLIPQKADPEVSWISLKSLSQLLSRRMESKSRIAGGCWTCLVKGSTTRRIIEWIFKAVELSLEEPSCPNQRYQENKVICPSAFISTELCRGQAAHREIFPSCFCRQCPTEGKLTLLRFYCSKTGRTAKPNLKHSFV